MTDPDLTDATRQKIQTLYPGIRPYCHKILADMKMTTLRPMQVTEATRSMEHQMELYKEGREFIHGAWIVINSSLIVTNAKPGLSFHNHGLAFDVACRGSDPYLKLLSPDQQNFFWSTYGSIVKKWSLQWGGDFLLTTGTRDLPHAELRYGLSISECVELYDRGGIHGVWSYLDHLRGIPEGTDW